MGYKTLLFGNPCKLSVKNRQLVIQVGDENPITVPLEDISTIILDNRQIVLTNYLLMACGENNITVFVCNTKHQPNAIMTPYFQHSRNTKISNIHINTGETLKKRLWQKIIKQKIANQSEVLKNLYDIYELDFYIEKVQSGDKTNVEGQASKKYWGMLFDDFKRHDKTKCNAMLDYGYAIIRGTLSKYIAASGLIPCFGIHHCNELNPFNLTEDLIEPFRPFVDMMIAAEKNYLGEALTRNDKAYILSILDMQCQYKKEQITIQNACERVCQSFVKSITLKDTDELHLPKFIEEK